MGRRTLALLLIALLAALPAAAQQGNEQTHFTVPSANATFLSDLRTFLYDEAAARFADQFASFVATGCIHGTAAGLTATPSACTAYPSGNYITETAAVTYADNATCWLAAHRDTSGNSGNFTRVGTSHYLLDCIDATQPTVPANAVYLLKVTTSGGSITGVLDLRVLTAPPGALATLTNQTGSGLVIGDVVAIDTAHDQSAALDDTSGSLSKFVAAVQSISSGQAGLFAVAGRAMVKVTGAVTRGHYLRKSATTKALEDTGTAMGAAAVPPGTAVGIALVTTSTTVVAPVLLLEPSAGPPSPTTAANGGTGFTSYTIGDTLFASGATTLSKLGIGTAGQALITNAGATAPSWSSTPVIALTNQTGVTLNAGDVVALDTANDKAVALADTDWGTRPYVVSVGTVNNLAVGLFATGGVITTVNTTGAVARGEYVRKSSTTKVVQTTGLSQGTAGVSRPYASLGVALTAAAAGSATVYWYPDGPTTSGLVYLNTTELTTSAGITTALLTISNLAIPSAATWTISALIRKTAGAAAAPTIELDVNGLAIFAATAFFSAANQAESGSFGYETLAYGGGSRAANYTQGPRTIAFTGTAGGTMTAYPVSTYTSQLPTAAITTIAIQGNSVSALVTLGLINVRVWVQ